MNIVPTGGDKLPRAIAKEKNGIVLYWIEELGIAGIHIRGIARILECDPKTISKQIDGVNFLQHLEAEIVTPGGVQGVNLISETDLAKLLRHITRSKAKPETRDRALDSLEKLAAAGFKLLVMLELAPQKLAEEVRQLPPVRDAIDYTEASKYVGSMKDGQLKRLLEARIVADLSIDRVNQNQLLSSEKPKQYTTVTVRAAQLGYTAQQIGNGSALGAFVGKYIEREFQEWQGKYQVWHYEVTDELDRCIHQYFSSGQVVLRSIVRSNSVRIGSSRTPAPSIVHYF